MILIEQSMEAIIYFVPVIWDTPDVIILDQTSGV